MVRILITGSREWTNDNLIHYALHEYVPLMENEVIVVSGACPRGADRICERIAEAIGWTVERYPANWGAYGKRAGYVRNAEMVTKGADVCLAFIRNNSPGATMCADLAESNGIKTLRWFDDTPIDYPLPPPHSSKRTGL